MDIFRTEGTGFGIDFNSNDVDLISWGTASLTLPSCDHLNIDFTGTENDEEIGTLNYSRLAGVQGMTCE